MKPIAIEVRGLMLDFEGSLRFKLLNPMFQQDAIPLITVFPFNLVGSPTNKRLLGYFNLAEDARNINSSEANIYLYGNLFLTGTIKWLWAKDHFECNFVQSLQLYEKQASLLNEIVYDEFDFTDEDGYTLFYNELKSKSDDSYAGTKDYVLFPMYNPQLFRNKASLKDTPGPYQPHYDTGLPDEYLQYVNYWDYSEAYPGHPEAVGFYFYNRGIVDYPTEDRNNSLVLSPSYYIKHLLERLFSYVGIGSIESPTFLDVADVEKMVLTSDKFFVMRQVQRDTLHLPYSSVWFFYFGDFPTFVFEPHKYLPDLTIVQFLNALKGMFNLSYFFSIIDGKVEIASNEQILTDQTYEDWTNKCFLLHSKEGSFVNGVTLKYTYGDDELPTDNVKSVRGMNILTPVTDYASLPTPVQLGDLCRVITENTYYITELNAFGFFFWSVYSQTTTHLAKTGAVEIESKSATWHTAVQEDQIEQQLQLTALGKPKIWRVPQAEIPGSSPRYGLNLKSSTYARFLFYRGMRSYVDHYNYYAGGATHPYYPYATCDEFAPDGSVAGNLSLLWNGDNGLYEKWWRNWLTVLENEVEIKRVVQLDINDVLNFNFKRKRMIDNIIYFMKEADVIISSQKGIEPAVFNFVKA